MVISLLTAPPRGVNDVLIVSISSSIKARASAPTLRGNRACGCR